MSPLLHKIATHTIILTDSFSLSLSLSLFLSFSLFLSLSLFLSSYVRFMVTVHYTDYDLPTLAVNLVALAILLLAKFPHMHKVRILNINSSPSG